RTDEGSDNISDHNRVSCGNTVNTVSGYNLLYYWKESKVICICIKYQFQRCTKETDNIMQKRHEEGREYNYHVFCKRIKHPCVPEDAKEVSCCQNNRCHH